MAFEFRWFFFETIEAWRQRQRQRHIWTLCIHLNIWHKHKNTHTFETMLANKNKWFDMQYAAFTSDFFFIKFGQRKLLNRIDTFRFRLLLTLARTISIKFDLILFILFVCVFFHFHLKYSRFSFSKASVVFSVGIDAWEMWTSHARLYSKVIVSDSLIQPKWNIKWRIGFIYQRYSSIYPNAGERKSATLDK